MQGRPSTMLKIMGVEIECLLDTGARSNVIREDIFRKLENVKLKDCTDKLRGASNGLLDIVSRILVRVQMGQRSEDIWFVVVKDLCIDVIAGMDLLSKFGFRLTRTTDNKDEDLICNIEAKFGRTISDVDRLKKAKAILLKDKDEFLNDIIEQNKGVFMADNWDIGNTK